MKEQLQALLDQAKIEARIAVELEAAKKSEFWEYYRDNNPTSDQAQDVYKAVTEANDVAIAKARFYVALHQAMGQYIQYHEDRDVYRAFGETFDWSLNI
jgi:hypothetical protein